MDINIQDATNVNIDQQPQLTSTAQEVVALQNQIKEQPLTIDPKIKKRNDEFKQRLEVCKLYRRKLIANMTVSVDYRRGKPFASQSDEDQIAVNLDWSLTKAKQASLFSQVPEIRIHHGEDLLVKTAPWALPFQKKLNDTLKDSGIEGAMDECLPDLINASGFGAVMVSYESIQEEVDLPVQPPVDGQPVDPNAPTTTVPRDADHRYVIQRLSPADFLWPINFTGSNFDLAPWIGRSGRITWAEAVQQFGLKEDEKAGILGEDRPMMDKLTHDVERDKVAADDMVGFDEVFYHEFQYDPDANNYTTIHRLVFISGKTDPVVDEPWKGQKLGPNGKVVGAQRYPIRVITLAYITDEAIPPSDSAIGRPQVNEINKARTQMIHQRERSIPIRTADINRVDPAIMQSLMRGTWQNIIPVQGDGSRIITEVARANMPPENFKFNELAMNDLRQEWTEPALSGADVETKGESNNLEQSAQLPRNRERARVAAFVVGIAEILGGLICLYEDPQLFGQGFDPAISTTLKYSILADSMVLLDANQRLARLNNFVNTYAKSGWVNLEPVLQEIAILSGLDPTIVIQPPQPKAPEVPNISLRLTGVEDMLNPLTLAMLMQSGQAPSDDLIEKAKALIQKAVEPPAGLNLQPGPAGPGGAPMLPAGVPPSAGLPPAGPLPTPPPPAVGEAHPQLAGLDKITKRNESGENS